MRQNRFRLKQWRDTNGCPSLMEDGNMLDELVEHDLLRIEGGGPARTYGFRRAVSQEVTYRLLSFPSRTRRQTEYWQRHIAVH